MRPILFISNIAWDFVWQRHQTLASLFAQDHDVIFCEVPGMRRVEWAHWRRILARLWLLLGANRRPPAALPARVTVLRPFVLPATNAAFCAANAWLIRQFVRRHRKLAGGASLIINYAPTRTARQLLAHVPHERLVYDCTDDFLAMRRIPRFLAADEQAILAEADLTVVPSRRLEELKRPAARRLVRIPHGALVDRFLVEPKERNASGPLTVVYYGHIFAQHLDIAAVETLARARPTWRIVLIGPVKTAHGFPPNVELPGQQAHAALRGWIRDADAIILPYALNDYTRAVLPAKTYECLATGRPIVAAPLPELVRDFSAHMRFVTTTDGWAPTIEAAVQGDSVATRDARIAIAKANGWDVRYRELRTLLAV